MQSAAPVADSFSKARLTGHIVATGNDSDRFKHSSTKKTKETKTRNSKNT